MPNIYDIPSPYLELLSALIGLCVGSFLNVVAVRSLAEKSLLHPGSHCPQCQHKLGLCDLIPVISYWLLKGKCRYCQAAIHWHYPLVELLTAVVFITIIHFFSTIPCDAFVDRSTIALFMLLFASTLIAVTVTDFKEKLIPHEITYPMVLVGLGFSQFFRTDLLGSLVGVGVSYLLFDLIAHYGLMFYHWLHPEILEEEQFELTQEHLEQDPYLDDNFDLSEEIAHEPLEVMGGADAVMAAVIGAWLGWEKLAIAVIVAFMVGALMGAVYLFDELRKEKLLAKALKPAAIGFGIMSVIPLLAVSAIVLYFKPVENPLLSPSIYLFCLAMGTAGGTFGILTSGVRVSKTFPFGPALAVGAAYAMSTISLSKDGGFIKPGA
ncbi:MAG: prepilin peptidase [Candidatus Melainabacteria bacterium]|nr:prepilin peptidase [Candidatus Melainabacteria bacterium]